MTIWYRHAVNQPASVSRAGRVPLLTDQQLDRALIETDLGDAGIVRAGFIHMDEVVAARTGQALITKARAPDTGCP